MIRPPFDLNELERLREVRNSIVHADGWKRLSAHLEVFIVISTVI
jgi:hypothetical protein